MKSYLKISNPILVGIILLIFSYLCIIKLNDLFLLEQVKMSFSTKIAYLIMFSFSMIYFIPKLLVHRIPNTIKILFIFFAYLLVQTFLVSSTEIGSFGETFSNSTWIIMFVFAYYFGINNYNFGKIDSALKLFLIITVPIISFICISNSYGNIGQAEISKDAFFIVIILFPSCFMLKNNKLRLFTIILFGILCFISVKRSIILGFILSSLFFYFFKNKKVSNLILIIFLIFIFFYLFDFLSGNLISDRFLSIKEDGGSGRDIIYSIIYNKILSFNSFEFLFGKGIGSVSKIFGYPAHQDFIEIFYSLGFLGFIVFLSFLFGVFRDIYLSRTLSNSIARCSLIATFILFLILSNMNCFIFNPPLMFPIMFWLGLYCGVTKKEYYIKNK